MLRSPTTSVEEVEKIADQLLKEALENQTITIRRLGVKVSELSEIQGQSDITSYFQKYHYLSDFLRRLDSMRITTKMNPNSHGKNIISPAIL